MMMRVRVRKTQGFEGFHYLSQTKLMRATRNEFDLVILTDSQKEIKNKQRKVDFIYHVEIYKLFNSSL